MKIFKPKFWEKENYSFFSILLAPFSYLLLFLYFIKKIFTGKTKFNCPIICVGNIYLGGTGKTPLSIEISRILAELNKKPAIIKKYYKNQLDEISLIKNKTNNIFFDKSRVKAIKKAITHGKNVMVLDDGFQDHSLYKNLDILCFNENQLIGNGLTIPAGPLRESLNSIIRSKIIIINGNKNKSFEEKLKKINIKIKIYYSQYIPEKKEGYEKKKIIAFAGIGNPNNFYNLLEKNNLNVVKKISFPDHYFYTKKELDTIMELAKKDNCEIITTEKDFIRIQNMKNYNEYQKIKPYKVKLKIFNKEEFIEDLKVSLT